MIARAKTPVIAVTAVCTVALARPASAADGEPRYAPVEIETNFQDEDPARTKRVQPVLEKSVIDALEHRHRIEVTEDSTTTIAFVVRNLEADPKAKRQLAVMDYGVLVEVRIDGEKVGDEVVFCNQKGEAELVDCAIEGIPPILQFLPHEEASEPVADPPPIPAENRDPPAKPDRVAPIHWWGVAGIVVAVGGLGAAIAGAVDLGRGEQVESGWGTNQVTEYGTRGRILLGTGLGLLAVGTVVFAVDVGLQAKKRRRATSRFELEVRPGFAGATVRGRF